MVGRSLADSGGSSGFGSGFADGTGAVSRREIREDRDGRMSRKDGAGGCGVADDCGTETVGVARAEGDAEAAAMFGDRWMCSTLSSDRCDVGSRRWRGDC